MTRNLSIEPQDFDQILSQSEKHFADATEIWNSFGVTSPQLRPDATRAARSMYTTAAELLDPDLVRSLPQHQRTHVLVFRERILAQAATMSFYCSDNCEEQIGHLGEAREHLRQAEALLIATKS